jgi:hypothetical protein
MDEIKDTNEPYDIHHCHEIYHMDELNFVIEKILLRKFTTWMKMMVSHMWIEVCWFEGFIFIFLPL